MKDSAPIWAKYDKNGDGELARSEAFQFFDEYFQYAEGSKINDSAKESLFNILDRSKDGKISRAEFDAKAPLFFQGLGNK